MKEGRNLCHGFRKGGSCSPLSHLAKETVDTDVSSVDVIAEVPKSLVFSVKCFSCGAAVLLITLVRTLKHSIPKQGNFIH